MNTRNDEINADFTGETVMSQKTIIAASLRAADFANLGKESHNVLSAGADVIHFDVLDYHIAPEVTFGSHVCASLRKYGIKEEINVHLMVADPIKYIAAYAKAGVNCLIFHPETVTNVKDVCDKIHAAGMQAGFAFNPDRSFSIAPELLSSIEMMLIMGVFSKSDGKEFANNSLEKIRSAKQLIEESMQKIMLGVDGGINKDNIRSVVDVGANFIAMGSALFDSDNYSKYIKQLRKEIE